MSPETKIYVKLGTKKYQLPVNPEEIEVSYPSQDQTESVTGIGEVAIPVKPSLRQVSWDGFFPGSDDVWVSKYRSPRKLAKAFQSAWQGRVKCRVIISRSNGFDTNMMAMITDFAVTDKGGEPEDLYYSVTFTEYREYGAQTMQIVNPAPTSTTAEPVSVDGQEIVAISADAPKRDTVTDDLYVGLLVSMSGTYYATSSGGEPSKVCNGCEAEITRIEEGQPYPYKVGVYGWVTRDQISKDTKWGLI